MKSIRVANPSMPLLEEYVEEIRPLFESKWLTNMGEKHRAFESQLKDFLDIAQVSLTVNGHLALENIINALHLKGEIITTPYSFVSTTHAIVRCGCTPVFCDIRESDYTIDVNKIEELITERTCAIMPVHVYGNICQVEKIAEIAKKHHLYVIYDAAHAFGENYKGASVAQFGDASVFSFHATKVFNTIEGGCIAFRNNNMQATLDDIKNFGFHNQESVLYVGGNAKMNEFQAAMGICNLRHIRDEIAKRKQIYKEYERQLGSIEGISIWRPQKEVDHNFAYFPILIGKEFSLSRDALFKKFRENDILVRKYFFPIIPDYECYKDSYGAAELPVARQVADNILTLPMHTALNNDIIDEVCGVIRKNM